MKAIGGYLDSARLLGRRTAELHAALSSDPDRSRLRAGADLAPRPAIDLPVDQRAFDARDRPPAHAGQQAAR